MVRPDGQSLQQAKVRGSNIGRNKQVRKLPVVAPQIATPQATLLEHTCKRCLAVTNSTSHLFATVATSVETTFGLTLNW